MPTRRDVLSGCGAAAVAGVLPGCSALPFGGGDGTPAYADWFPDREEGYARFGSLRLAALADRDLPEGLVQEQVLGLDAGDVDRYMYFEFGGSGATVLRTTLADEDLRDRLESDLVGTLQPRDVYAGYDRYDVEDSSYVVALEDGTAVVAEAEPLEAVVDAEAGERDRLYDENEDFEVLVDALGSGDRVEGRLRLDEGTPGPFLEDGEVGNGDRSDVGTDTTDQTHAAVFGSEEDVDEDAVRERLETDGVDDLSTSLDGRVVTATYSMATEDLLSDG